MDDNFSISLFLMQLLFFAAIVFFFVIVYKMAKKILGKNKS